MEKSLRDKSISSVKKSFFASVNSFLVILQLKTTNHSDKAPYELKILEVVRVDVGCRVDLQTVVIFAGIFEEAIHGVQNLVWEQEEPLPGRERTTKCGEQCLTAAKQTIQKGDLFDKKTEQILQVNDIKDISMLTLHVRTVKKKKNIKKKTSTMNVKTQVNGKIIANYSSN